MTSFHFLMQKLFLRGIGESSQEEILHSHPRPAGFIWSSHLEVFSFKKMAHNHRTTLQQVRARQPPAGVRHVRRRFPDDQGVEVIKKYSCPVGNHHSRKVNIHHNRDDFVFSHEKMMVCCTPRRLEIDPKKPIFSFCCLAHLGSVYLPPATYTFIFSKLARQLKNIIPNFCDHFQFYSAHW